ncbi:hypothetical protein [Bacteroides sp.]|uniref:hypothetical protein n=1 Tax=Bacteroides sp. TaxID=29523 RepID=UPI002617BBE4|nr:hypothetical protein [Bacteroides sp.]MDD3040051.1 hypothetical protein [Bacteroides sp.]
MDKKQYNKLTAKAVKISGDMKELAAFIVDTDCRTMEHTPVIGDQRDVLIQDFSTNMRLGELITRNKYLALGVLVGISVTAGVIQLKQVLIKKDEESK